MPRPPTDADLETLMGFVRELTAVHDRRSGRRVQIGTFGEVDTLCVLEVERHRQVKKKIAVLLKEIEWPSRVPPAVLERVKDERPVFLINLSISEEDFEKALAEARAIEGIV